MRRHGPIKVPDGLRPLLSLCTAAERKVRRCSWMTWKTRRAYALNMMRLRAYAWSRERRADSSLSWSVIAPEIFCNVVTASDKHRATLCYGDRRSLWDHIRDERTRGTHV